MPDSAPMDFGALKREIRRTVQQFEPGARRIELLVVDAHGQRTSAEIVCGIVTDNVPDCRDVRLSEGEREILEAFEGVDAGAVLAVADIARRVGCDNNGHFRGRLGRLVRFKRLVNERPGYRLP